MSLLRPEELSEIVGQERAIKSLISKLSSPYPQHIILYGPPGVGKTTAARIALKEALRSLDEKPRQIIMLRYFKDKTQMEVAKMLGISQVQVSRIEKKVLTKMLRP